MSLLLKIVCTIALMLWMCAIVGMVVIPYGTTVARISSGFVFAEPMLAGAGWILYLLWFRAPAATKEEDDDD